MSGAEIPLIMSALGGTAAGAGAGAAAAGAAGIPAGIAGLFGATGAASPMAASLLGPAAATPFVTGLPAAGIGGGTAASAFGPAAGAGLSQIMAPAPLGLGAPPAMGSNLLGMLGKGAQGAMSGQQEQNAPPPVPLPNNQVESEQFSSLFQKYLQGLDPVSKQMLMSRMRGR